MSPVRLQYLPSDTAMVIGTGALLGSVILDLVAPMNILLVIGFTLAIMCNFVAGVLRSYAVHRRSGVAGKWFETQRASFGLLKKFALFLFVPLAGIVDGTFMLSTMSAPIAEHTPTIKAVLLGLTGVQVIGAARSLHVVVGDEAIPALAVLLRAIDREHAGGRVPQRRVTDPVIGAYAQERPGPESPEQET